MILSFGSEWSSPACPVETVHAVACSEIPGAYGAMDLLPGWPVGDAFHLGLLPLERLFWLVRSQLRGRMWVGRPCGRSTKVRRPGQWADGKACHAMESPRPTGCAGIPGRLVIPPEDREMEVEVGEVYR